MSDSARDAFEEGAASLANELQSELDDATRRVKDGFAKAADGFEDGAEVLKDGVRRTGEGVRKAGRRVRSAVHESSDYFREHGARGAFREVETLVREHPGKALLAMAAVGFLIGHGMRRRT